MDAHGLIHVPAVWLRSLSIDIQQIPGLVTQQLSQIAGLLHRSGLEVQAAAQVAGRMMPDLGCCGLQLDHFYMHFSRFGPFSQHAHAFFRMFSRLLRHVRGADPASAPRAWAQVPPAPRGKVGRTVVGRPRPPGWPRGPQVQRPTRALGGLDALGPPTRRPSRHPPTPETTETLQ